MDRSTFFIVDGVPSPGEVQLLPAVGQALQTRFAFTTAGWSDEDPGSIVVNLRWWKKKQQPSKIQLLD